jgi:hypothetical protein
LPYEVCLAVAAREVVLRLGSDADRKDLAVALREELGDDGPNAQHQYPFCLLDDGYKYTAVPLSFRGFVAVYRRMTDAELHRFGKEQGRKVGKLGYLLADLLPPESAFSHRTSVRV